MNEDEEGEVIEWFGKFGISKRSLLTLPIKDLKSIKDEIEKSFLQKTKMNQIIKDFVKKDIVDRDYLPKSVVESEYSKIKFPPTEEIKCQSCNNITQKTFIDLEGKIYNQRFCMICGFDFETPPVIPEKRRYRKGSVKEPKKQGRRVWKGVRK
jgi:hypothetical protein